MTGSRLGVVALFVVALLACAESATQPPAVLIGGTWSGQTATQATLTLHLIQFDVNISGTGVLSGPSGSIVSVTVRGVHLHPDLGLTLEADGYADVTLIGTVAPSTITASLDGSGFTDTPVTLTKQ